MSEAKFSRVAIARSLNARQHLPSETPAPAADEYWNEISTVKVEYPDRSTAKATIRGFTGNYVTGPRGAEPGQSPNGDYVRSNTYGAKACPQPKYTDMDTRRVQEAKIDPRFDLVEEAVTDLTGKVEKQVHFNRIVKL